MNRLTGIILAAGCALSATSQAKDPASDAKAVVASRGGVQITMGEIDARMAEIPADKRAGTFEDPRRIEAQLDDMLLFKQLAKEARATGLEKDPKYQAALLLLTERLQAAFYGEALAKAETKADVETLARESYQSDPKRFSGPERLHVRHILIKTGPGCRTLEMAKALIDKVRAEALAGKDFSELATTYSEDEASRVRGGELPLFGKGQMLPSFEAAANALQEPGAISDVVATKFGYHVIQLIGREPGRQKSFEEVKPELMKTLASQQTERSRREHIDQLRSMKLDANPDLVASLRDRYIDATLPAVPTPVPAAAPAAPTQQQPGDEAAAEPKSDH